MPQHPRRIRVVGISGSGKTTLAVEIARRTGLPHLELDAVFWGPGWEFRALDEAHRVIDEFVATNPDGWVIDGNWSSRLDGRLDPGSPGGADLVVWLDHPRSIVMARLVRRTLRRGILREELWHGNRERPSTWFARDPHKNILRWAWVQHAIVRERMQALSQEWPVVRIARPRDAAAWLAGLCRE
ncbi:toxin [Microbacterium sp. CFH 90308]|uniref:Toxin n=1 Tax=Microbacterium salsuginis TaxID=2722803 RepID=A0ABX1KCT5_9MICO|nr:toxin [Microbacterium sp. CFH 90308]NLP83783.1 toxin [Microbacterium sp. CFH 90308]